MEILIGARLIQGVAAALIHPNVLAVVGVVFSGSQRTLALTAYGLVAGFAAVSAQLIGGLLIHVNLADLGWRSVFLINIPIGIVVVLLAGRLVPESRADGATRLDLAGTALITIAMAALLLPLIQGSQLHWPIWLWLTLAAAPVLVAVFFIYQLRLERLGRSPLLPPSLFRDRALSAGLSTQLVLSAGQAPFFLVLALYLQQGRGLQPLEAGVIFTISVVAYLLTSLIGPRLVPRFGRNLLACAAVTMAAGEILLILTAQLGSAASVLLVVPGLALVGAGLGLGIAPLISIVLAGVEPRHAGAASGVLTTTQQLGNALGVAVTGLIFQSALPAGYERAFEWSLVQLIALVIVLLALTRALPRAPYSKINVPNVR